MSKPHVVAFCAAPAFVLLVAACGDDSDGGGTDGGATQETGTTEGARVIDPALMDSAKGELRYCQGKDTAGNTHEMIERFNEQFGADLQAKLVEFRASADEQRNQFIQRQQANSGDSTFV